MRVVSLSCYNRLVRDLFFTVLEAGSPTWRLWLLWSQGKLLFHILDGTGCLYVAEREHLSVSCEGTDSSLHSVRDHSVLSHWRLAAGCDLEVEETSNPLQLQFDEV